MAELITNNFQNFTLDDLKTQEGLRRLNEVLRNLSQNSPGDGEAVRILKGVGTPEASITASIGSLYMRTDGGTDTSIYRKESGTGNTGWVAITTNPDTVAWTDYSATSTVVGWSSFTTKSIYYKKVGKLVFVGFKLDGTSDATTASFTVPYTPATGSNGLSPNSQAYTVNNGTQETNGGISISDTTASLSRTPATSAWTASGTKHTQGQFWYEATV